MLVTVRYLRQQRPEALRPAPTCPDCVLVRPPTPPVALIRLMYLVIGDNCSWRSRRVWTDQQWRSAMRRPGTELWVQWHRDQPSGFAELGVGAGHDRASTRLRYLGVLPDYHCRGLGGWLLTAVTERAWTAHQRYRDLPAVRRVLVETNQLDSPRALPNYLARGFELAGWRREQRDEEVSRVPRPRDPGERPESCATAPTGRGGPGATGGTAAADGSS